LGEKEKEKEMASEELKIVLEDVKEKFDTVIEAFKKSKRGQVSTFNNPPFLSSRIWPHWLSLKEMLNVETRCLLTAGQDLTFFSG
jgi:hypothetical protein